MDSLSDTVWDLVLCGTGLQQSLLALALSRSDLKVLHLDPNDYYGGPDAALSLQEAEAWAQLHRGDATDVGNEVFSGAAIVQQPAADETSRGKLSFSRAYSLALAPQIVHAKSDLLSQLVSSRAYRQLEFLAVGSFFVLRPGASHASDDAADAASQPTLTRIPSTREDVFSSTALAARSKRALMKFLKFVLEYDSEDSMPQWAVQKDEPLSKFLQQAFGLDGELQAYILALTLSLDGKISTGDGLVIIHRHLTSMGFFGPGFAAVYPKWGGLSEVAQVACRAGAVGGAVYMLSTAILSSRQAPNIGDGAEQLLELELSNGSTIRTKKLARQSGKTEHHEPRTARLIAVLGSQLDMLFDAVVEGAPTPAVAVVVCPAGSILHEAGLLSDAVYGMVHSAECGECPAGQSVLYLSTTAVKGAREVLSRALSSILTAAMPGSDHQLLYQLYYEQSHGGGAGKAEDLTFEFPAPSAELSFQDGTLNMVRNAWRFTTGDKGDYDAEYMSFSDREGVVDDDDM